MSEPVVLTEVKNKLGHIALNSPKSLNSLSLEMIQSILPTLKKWQDDPDILAVVLQGSGEKAFCAGGDVVTLYKSMVEAKEKSIINEKALNFFVNEYTLDYTIHTYKKPVICLADGITMGGGIGLMNGCSHRIVTEKTMLAMPEITIGLYPDVAGSFFLSRLPAHQGRFLGLTGGRMNAADCLKVKMADYYASSEELAVFKDKLSTVNDIDELNSLFTQLEKNSCPLESSLEKFDKKIQEIFNEPDLEIIFQKATQEIEKTESKWLSRSLQSLLRGCPTSAHLVMEQLKRGKEMSLKDVFKMELNMSMGCVNNGEFEEGVRALLIDKDNSPKWNPATISEVSSEQIAQHFQTTYSLDI